MGRSKKRKPSRKATKNRSKDRSNKLRLIGTIIAWPFKMLGRLIALIHKASERNAKRVVRERQRPKSKPNPEPLTLIEAEKGSIAAFDTALERSSIGIILGARGSGKTALGLRLLENADRPCAAMGFREESLPKWVTPVSSVDDVPNSSCVLVDEGGILFSSRSSMSEANKVLSELILISRHKDLSIIFISQNSSNLEVNVLRQADYLLLKPASLLQLDFERKVIEKIYKKAKGGFERYKDIEGLVYVYSDAYRGFAKNTLPSFWGESLSTQFKEKTS